jgi:hypothetical protein
MILRPILTISALASSTLSELEILFDPLTACENDRTGVKLLLVL